MLGGRVRGAFLCVTPCCVYTCLCMCATWIMLHAHMHFNIVSLLGRTVYVVLLVCAVNTDGDPSTLPLLPVFSQREACARV